MIVIDTSALVAIAQREPEHDALSQMIAKAGARCLPVSCYLETTMVLSRWRVSRAWIDRYIEAADIEIYGSGPRQA